MMPRKPNKPSAEKAVRDIRRATRRRYSAEEKIRIVFEGLRGEDSIADTVPPRGAQCQCLLPLVEGVPGSRKEASVCR
jgi:hypothetical protein